MVNSILPVIFDGGVKDFDSYTFFLYYAYKIIVATETLKDKTLRKILRFIQNEWPKLNELNDIEKSFHLKRNELDVEQGCLMWGHRLVIPESFQYKMLGDLHISHCKNETSGKKLFLVAWHRCRNRSIS